MYPWIGPPRCRRFHLLNRVPWQRIARLILSFHNQGRRRLVLLKRSKLVNVGSHPPTWDLLLLGITFLLLLPKTTEQRTNVRSMSMPSGERKKQELVFAEHHSMPLMRRGNKLRLEIKLDNARL